MFGSPKRHHHFHRHFCEVLANGHKPGSAVWVRFGARTLRTNALFSESALRPIPSLTCIGGVPDSRHRTCHPRKGGSKATDILVSVVKDRVLPIRQLCVRLTAPLPGIEEFTEETGSQGIASRIASYALRYATLANASGRCPM